MGSWLQRGEKCARAAMEAWLGWEAVAAASLVLAGALHAAVAAAAAWEQCPAAGLGCPLAARQSCIRLEVQDRNGGRWCGVHQPPPKSLPLRLCSSPEVQQAVRLVEDQPAKAGRAEARRRTQVVAEAPWGCNKDRDALAEAGLREGGRRVLLTPADSLAVSARPVSAHLFALLLLTAGDDTGDEPREGLQGGG
jgi:hypothetical protein